MNAQTSSLWSWSPIDEGDARQFSPSADRNQQPIIETISRLAGPIANGGHALELASGTGQHVVGFARAFPAIAWQPSDVELRSLASIDAHRKTVGLGNLKPPLRIDLTDNKWAAAVEVSFDLIFASNVLHIAPFAVMENLLKGAAQLLRPEGALAVYGPMKRHGDWLSDGNRDFDRQLKNTDPELGLRDVAEVETLAHNYGLELDAVIAMPANNSMLVLRSSGHHSASSS